MSVKTTSQSDTSSSSESSSESFLNEDFLLPDNPPPLVRQTAQSDSDSEFPIEIELESFTPQQGIDDNFIFYSLLGVAGAIAGIIFFL